MCGMRQRYLTFDKLPALGVLDSGFAGLKSEGEPSVGRLGRAWAAHPGAEPLHPGGSRHEIPGRELSRHHRDQAQQLQVC